MKYGLISTQKVVQQFAGVTPKEARRLIRTGQVKVHGRQIKDPELFCEIKKNTVVEVGLLEWTVVH